MQILDDALIHDEYAANFKPARYALIQHMYRKVTSPEHCLNKSLIDKTRDYIRQYQSELDEGREVAQIVLGEIKINYPECYEDAQTLYRECQFNKLTQMNLRLSIKQKSKDVFTKLTGVIAQMQSEKKSESEFDPVMALEAQILCKEQFARKRVGAVEYVSNDHVNDQWQLQSLKTARESMRFFNLDRSIERAIEDFPENAGPHNPHMLAITSLMNMRDLSPQYLRRFAGYIETVLWLEKNETKLNRKK